MKKNRRVLWIDDQANQVEGWTEAMTAAGWEVLLERTHHDAEQTLRNDQHGFDLLIVNPRAPTKGEEQGNSYTAAATNNGLTAGLLFFTRNKDLLDSTQTPILVFAQRTDQDVLKLFEEAGLPKGHFATKFALGRIDDFFRKIEQITGFPRYTH